MQITTSYKVKITGGYNYKKVYLGKKNKNGKPIKETVIDYEKNISINKKALKDTYTICRKALSFIIDVVNKEWFNIKDLDKNKKVNQVENYIHNTSKNKAKYDFDLLFYKFPSYLRRDLISSGIGIVGSYKSNYKNWEEKVLKAQKSNVAIKVSNPPKLSFDHFYMPTFYKNNMYRSSLEKNSIELKLFIKNDWVWVPFKLRATDIKYITKHLKEKEQSNPTLVKIDKNYYIRFSYNENKDLVNKDPLNIKALGVDLGINNNAVMSVLDSTGTVYARKFINLTYEKDQLYHTLNCIKKYQQKGIYNKALWRKANNINTDISRKTAKGIIDFAISQNIDCIVFEFLDTKGKKKGNKKQRLHLWRRKEIQKIVESKAHRCGIRISHICAWNTSKLAFDGTGFVERGKYYIKDKEYYNYSICVFKTGKQYNCDLNASYNIGARFFLRTYNNIYKDINIKTPQRTLSTLINYYKNLNTEEDYKFF